MNKSESVHRCRFAFADCFLCRPTATMCPAPPELTLATARLQSQPPPRYYMAPKFCFAFSTQALLLCGLFIAFDVFFGWWRVCGLWVFLRTRPHSAAQAATVLFYLIQLTTFVFYYRPHFRTPSPPPPPLSSRASPSRITAAR